MPAGLVKASDGDSTVTKLDDFDTLEKAMKDVDPKGTTLSEYKPSGQPMACPPVNSTWQANGTSLPPTPNDAACSCAANASTCVPVSGISAEVESDLFNQICADTELCSIISGNTTTGEYGTYSMCSDDQKIAILLGAYHTKHSSDANSCSFGGNATTQKGSGKKDCASLAPSSGSGGGKNSSDKDSFAAAVQIPSYGFVASVASLAALVATAMVAM